MNRNAIIAAFLFAQLLTWLGAAGALGKDTGLTFSSSVPTAYMEDPRRIEWQKPEKIIDHLLVKQGDVVADIGAGTGYFTMLFARSVGKNGVVYAVDVNEDMVGNLKKRVDKEGVNNVKNILATPSDPLLPKSSIDLIFICDTYLFFENRVEYLVRLRDNLKQNGRLAIISFNEKAEIPGAPPLHKMISREKTIQEAITAGYAVEAEYFFLPYHDFIVFTKR
jgi:ubiquinone/menaquinone biosynthesis C-methylase UbiE